MFASSCKAIPMVVTSSSLTLSAGAKRTAFAARNQYHHACFRRFLEICFACPA
ncbi:hypothetical protein ACLK15_10275 [Escherichia coli]